MTEETKLTTSRVTELGVEQERERTTTRIKIGKTIVVPLDGSKLAESVLPHVQALAEEEGIEQVEVILLRVCDTPVILADYPEAIMPLTWEEHIEHEIARHKSAGKRYLAEVEKRLTDAGFYVRSEVLLGEPAEEIVKYVNENHCNLIAIATDRRSRFIRWLQGSVADKVLRRAQSPVYLVRA